jgi:transposase
MGSEVGDRPSYDELLGIVRDLRARVAELERTVATRDRRIEALEAENRKLRGQLEEAQRAGKRQAAPFSKGPPKPEPKPPGRKAGTAHGPAAFRKAPPKIDDVVDVPLPEECPDCGIPIEEDRVAYQYQTEIPRVEPFLRRFDIHVGHCPCCRRRFQGRHPLQTSDALGAAASQLGPNVLALAAHLGKVAGLPYRKIVAFLKAAFGVVASAGGLARALQRIARRFEPTYESLLSRVRTAPVVYPDETGGRVGGLPWWLWVFVTKDTTAYVLRPSRGFDVVEEVLGKDFQGAVGHDGWAPYDKLLLAEHQQCLAHLLRRAKEMLEVATRGAVRFPRKVKALLQDALELRDRRDAHEISSHGLAVVRGRLERRLRLLLGMRLSNADNRRFRNHLRNHEDQILTFLRREDLEATSWPADHAIRPAVLFRKVSGGHRSELGARTHEILLSVYRTCWQRSADAIALTAKALRSPREQVLRLPALASAR